MGSDSFYSTRKLVVCQVFKRILSSRLYKVVGNITGEGKRSVTKLIGAANIVVQGKVEGDIAHTHYTFRMDRYRKIFILWFPNKTCFKKN